LGFKEGEMDHKTLPLMMMMLPCFLIAVAGTTINQSSYSESQHFVWNERNALEEGHHERDLDLDDHPYSERDLDALLSFKEHIISDPSGRLCNWTAQNSKEVCSWYGITCTQHSRRVVAIILPVPIILEDGLYFGDPKLQLGGTLSPSLGSLSSLQTLNLCGNNFTGLIPPQLGHLKALRLLNLSFNDGLEGSIPKSLSNCTGL
jgi:hypothetical protein